jgi:hypothetical protein
MVVAVERAKPPDGSVRAAGNVAFAPLEAIAAAGFGKSVYALGRADTLLGQVNPALAVRTPLGGGGSMTLLGGILSEQPVVAGSSASMINRRARALRTGGSARAAARAAQRSRQPNRAHGVFSRLRFILCPYQACAGRTRRPCSCALRRWTADRVSLAGQLNSHDFVTDGPRERCDRAGRVTPPVRPRGLTQS